MVDKSLRRLSEGPPRRDEVRDLMRRFLEESDSDTLTWDSVTTKDGLPHNWIYDLFEDSRGRVWVGTWGGGLAIYENGSWTRYGRRHGLASKAVTCIREDAEGTIWVATDGGLNRWDGSRFVDAGLRGKSILNLHVDRQQNLWVACWRATQSGGGLLRFDGSEWHAFSAEDGLRSRELLKVFEDSHGRIWAGTYEHGQGAGVACWDGSAWQELTRQHGLIDDCVYSMFEDPDGNMWFGTLGGVSVYDGSAWHRITTMDGLVDDRVYAMFIDADKKMWFGTEGGVSRFDGTTWESFTKNDGLVEDLVRTIVQDRDGTLWFGTYPYAKRRGGISRARTATDRPSLLERAERYLSPGREVGELGQGQA